MAKESMITRTITTTLATVLCLDVVTGEPCNRTFKMPRVPKKESDILKFASKELADTDPDVHAVHVVDTAIDEKIYGMTESEFLKYAVPVTRTTAKKA